VAVLEIVEELTPDFLAIVSISIKATVSGFAIANSINFLFAPFNLVYEDLIASSTESIPPSPLAKSYHKIEKYANFPS
jgi:hypothetical protein